MDYRSVGVNIPAANKLIQWLKRQTKSNNIGAYGGVFPAYFPNIKRPFLVAAADGVGTKLQLATYFKSYKEVGQDLVAMCVNDLICMGASPLFFLDYYACAKLEQKPAKEFLKGVLSACAKSSCLLLGGETAEMPGAYPKGEFDAAGFAIGVVDQNKILGAHKVKEGDLIVGVSSSGFHSNGFSLLRKILKHSLQTWKKELLKPTALYVALAKDLFAIKGLKAIAHITGGGIHNIERVLPKGLQAAVQIWDIPDIFIAVQKKAKMTKQSLLKTFNCGVGLALILQPSTIGKVSKLIQKHGFSVIEMGQIQKAKKGSSKWTMC